MYSTTDLDIFKKKYRLFSILFFVSIFLLIALFVLSLCFTNYKNYLYFEIIGGVIASIFVFICILFYFRLIDYKRLINHYLSVFNEKKTYIDGTFLSLGEYIITLDDNIRVKEAYFEVDNNKVTYYILSIFDTENLKANTKYNVLLADRFIRSFNYEI